MIYEYNVQLLWKLKKVNHNVGKLDNELIEYSKKNNSCKIRCCTTVKEDESDNQKQEIFIYYHSMKKKLKDIIMTTNLNF